MKFFEQLKKRWEITSNKDFWLIILTFALTGSGISQLKQWLTSLIGLHYFDSFWLHALFWIFIMTPIYLAILPLIGKLLGQRSFFKKHQNKLLRRFKFWK